MSLGVGKLTAFSPIWWWNSVLIILFFLLLTCSPKVFAQEKGKIVTKVLIQIYEVCFLKLFGKVGQNYRFVQNVQNAFSQEMGAKCFKPTFFKIDIFFHIFVVKLFFNPSFQSFVYWKFGDAQKQLLFLIRFLLFCYKK